MAIAWSTWRRKELRTRSSVRDAVLPSLPEEVGSGNVCCVDSVAKACSYTFWQGAIKLSRVCHKDLIRPRVTSDDAPCRTNVLAKAASIGRVTQSFPNLSGVQNKALELQVCP